MTYHYVVGAKRWRRHNGTYDVRAYRPAKGWDATAVYLDTHPISGRTLSPPQWWICETYEGSGE